VRPSNTYIFEFLVSYIFEFLVPQLVLIMNDEVGFTPFVSLCFTINYVMGTGFLTLPDAFNSAGIALALVTLTSVAFLANISKNFVLEAMARAELLHPESTTIDELLLEKGSEPNHLPHSPFELLAVKERKFEVVELCKFFLGDRGGKAYMTTFGFYMYGCLWAYTAVFGNAMASVLPLHTSDDYLLYVFLFAVFTVPLTCMELREQVFVQVSLTQSPLALRKTRNILRATTKLVPLKLYFAPSSLGAGGAIFLPSCHDGADGFNHRCCFQLNHPTVRSCWRRNANIALRAN